MDIQILDNKKNKVFLGGTCNNSTWREQLIPMLTCDYFNPVVDDWTEECQAIENEEKANDKVQRYVITPLMEGVFSIAEAVQSSNDMPKGTVFCYLHVDNTEVEDEAGNKVNVPVHFSKAQLKSLKATANLIKNNGAYVCETIEECATIVNEILKEE